jgi:hypothetical protein
VTLSALTGLPLNPEAVLTLDKKLSAALQEALKQNPQERPQSVEEFADSLDRSGGGGLNMKVVIFLIAVLGAGGVGGAYYMKQQKLGPFAVPARAAKASAKKAGGEKANGEKAATANGEGADTTEPAAGEGSTADSRLTVTTSFSTNPVPDAEEIRQAEIDPEKAAAAREAAREILDGIEKVVPDQKREKHAQAMENLATAIRLSGGEPTEDDIDLIKDLFDRPAVQEIQKDYFKRVNESLHDEKLSRVRSIYPKLAAVDADVNEFEFFNKNKSVGIKTLKRSDSSSKDDETEGSEE